MTIKLIALDIDGTVADGDNNISPANEENIKKAINHGIKIALVTGRHREGVRKAMEVLNLDQETPLILNNGALIYWQGRIVWKDFLTEDEADGVIKFSTKIPGVATTIFKQEDVELHCNLPLDREWVMDRLRVFEIIPEKIAEKPEELTRENVAKIMLVTESGDKALEIYKIWPQKLSHLKRSRSYPYICEINSSTCDKGRGLKMLCEKLGISPEEVLAVGDGETDIPMLNYAKNAVFVRHSDYLPKLPPHVKVTPKGYHDKGVAWAIENYLKL
mgnify:CR=1 FL=1|jgi:Cof subfamily protein (haloacid dehalogenase superfamily)